MKVVIRDIQHGDCRVYIAASGLTERFAKPDDRCIFWNNPDSYALGTYGSELKARFKYFAKYDVFHSLPESFLRDTYIWDMADLVGMVFTGYERHSDYLMFFASHSRVVLFNHDQECCERVYLADVVGDLDDLVGSEILQASCETKDAGSDDADQSATWSFYKFATAKGYVDTRWLGESSRYYSETVDCRIFKLATCIEG